MIDNKFLKQNSSKGSQTKRMDNEDMEWAGYDLKMDDLGIEGNV